MNKNYYSRLIGGKQVSVKQICNAWDLDRWETQAVQYLLRSKYKDEELEDLRKARDFIDYAIESLEERQTLDKMLTERKAVTLV